MSRSTTRIQRAILSVTDKTGLVDFAHQLSGFGIELVSTARHGRAPDELVRGLPAKG